MTPQNRDKELKRLITAFEHQADKFHDLTLSIAYFEKHQTSYAHPIKTKHHGIFLWQFVGALNGVSDNDELAHRVENNSLKWGIPDAELTCVAIIEGDAHEMFVTMARRAASIFSKDETDKFKLAFASEIIDAERTRNPNAKPVTSNNSNPLAVWINYLLYYVSQTHPGREKTRRIEPDPFSLSLMALEDLQSRGEAVKMEPSFSKLSNMRFKVALSFPGEKRSYVEQVTTHLKSSLGEESVFYDFDYQAHLCRPNVDVILQNIYHRQSDLIVVFLCHEYAKKEWCGLEFRAIRDLIKKSQGNRIILVKFDDVAVDGIFSIDGYLDANKFSPAQIAAFIVENFQTNAIP